MMCLTCGRRAFTIGGCCRVCAPGRHDEHDALLARYDVARALYLEETGCKPIADWSAFELWCEEHGRI